MSCTTLYQINPDGDVVAAVDFPNAFRSAIAVWIDLAKRYEVVPPGPEGLGMLLLDDKTIKRLWDLWKDPRLTEDERVVHLSTFDEALCRAEDFPKLIGAFRRYGATLPNSSLAEQADAIEKLPPDARGCGWRQTSVAAGNWTVHDDREEDDPGRPYNIDRDDDHFWIFESLAEKPPPPR
jgi:hypothetical protein